MSEEVAVRVLCAVLTAVKVSLDELEELDDYESQVVERTRRLVIDAIANLEAIQ